LSIVTVDCRILKRIKLG